MNFVRYDPATGEILNIGWMLPAFIEAEIAEGKPTISFEGTIEWGKWYVNLNTKQLELLPSAPTISPETPLPAGS